MTRVQDANTEDADLAQGEEAAQTFSRVIGFRV